MDFRQLKYFATIAEEGQITSAARRLHIAQPPLSQQLKALENELGVQLFERIPSGIKITEAGSLLLQRSYEIMALMENIQDELSTFRDGLEGILKIGTVSSSGSTLIDENFLSFKKAFPKIKFNLYEGNSFQIIEYLQKGVIEIGIVRTPFENEDFQRICWDATPMVAAGHKDFFPFQSHTKINLKDLEGHPILINRRYHQLLQSICQREAIVLDYFCLNNDARTTLQWANACLGIGIVPEETLRLQNYVDLEYAEIDHPQLYTQLCAIWDHNKPLSKIAQNFLLYFNHLDTTFCSNG